MGSMWSSGMESQGATSASSGTISDFLDCALTDFRPFPSALLALLPPQEGLVTSLILTSCLYEALAGKVVYHVV